MADPIIQKDFYKADVYRFDIENTNSTFQVDISNVISWDIIRLNMTKNDLRGLVDFINKHLENN